jgi:hypothetical protein
MRMKHLVLALWLVALPCAAMAQGQRGVVVDQTGSTLPGATVQLVEGTTVVATVTTDMEGAFTLPASQAGGTVVVSLSGFQTMRVPRADAERVMLPLARTEQVATVTAPIGVTSSPSNAALGNTLSAVNVTRLPSKNFKAKESLPLLPGVVRGPDGLLQLGGVRAHDTPLFLDGFNVTDPATGISNINLPFEAVRGVQVLRDPMAITHGDLLGGMITLESRTGGDEFHWGVQGVVPRPRFSTPGFGRIEGIFPRFYTHGSTKGKGLRYMTAVEYDFERIPVPDVTQGAGPDIVEQSATAFVRLDGTINDRQSLTVEMLAFPHETQNHGLSPRREEQATFDFASRDLFAGVTHRAVIGDGSVLTTQFGAFDHRTELTPNGEGTAVLSPDGWRGNWFARATRESSRYSGSVSWERTKKIGRYSHDFTTVAEFSSRGLTGRISESPIRVENADGVTVRTISFGPAADLNATDRRFSAVFRDVITFSSRTQIDAGARVDSRRQGGTAFSARAGFRHQLDEAGLTVVKAGYGKFVGTVPLGVPAFGGYPARIDRRFDADTGAMTTEIDLQPTLGLLKHPHAYTGTISLERQVTSTLDAQVVFTSRRSDRLATLRVPTISGPLTVESTGKADYRELQFSARKTWVADQQLFVSYVRSSGRGEVNDFTSLFGFVDAPLLQPGAFARLSSESRNRLLAWATINLPKRFVVSPVAEWRSGFPYSVLDHQYTYSETPNSRSFPAFFAADMVIYKTLTLMKRDVDAGIQLFNFTNHRNPRDVYAVTNAPHFGQFANSVGTILRGYVLVKW